MWKSGKEKEGPWPKLVKPVISRGSSAEDFVGEKDEKPLDTSLGDNSSETQEKNCDEENYGYTINPSYHHLSDQKLTFLNTFVVFYVCNKYASAAQGAKEVYR